MLGVCNSSRTYRLTWIAKYIASSRSKGRLVQGLFRTCCKNTWECEKTQYFLSRCTLWEKIDEELMYPSYLSECYCHVFRLNNSTPRKINIEPKHDGLEDYFPDVFSGSMFILTVYSNHLPTIISFIVKEDLWIPYQQSKTNPAYIPIIFSICWQENMSEQLIKLIPSIPIITFLSSEDISLASTRRTKFITGHQDTWTYQPQA